MNNIKGTKEFYDDTVEMWADDWYDNLTMLATLSATKPVDLKTGFQLQTPFFLLNSCLSLIPSPA